MLNPTSVTATITGSESIAVGDISAVLPSDSSIFQQQILLSDGEGVNQAERVGSSNFALTSGASHVFDLQALSGLNGNVVFTSAKAFAFVNKGVDPTDIIQWGDEGTTTNPWIAPFAGTNARFIQPPNSFLVAATASAAGWVIAAGNKSLKVKNMGTNTVNVSLRVLGTN